MKLKHIGWPDSSSSPWKSKTCTCGKASESLLSDWENMLEWEGDVVVSSEVLFVQQICCAEIAEEVSISQSAVLLVF